MIDRDAFRPLDGPIPLPRAVLFDLDGTLVDSLDDIAFALNAARSTAGMQPVSATSVRGWIGGGAARLVARSFGTEDEAAPGVAEMLAQFLAIYGAESGARSPILPGVGALLESLSSRGVLLACTTNKPGDATALVLRSSGLLSFFRAVVTPDTLGVRKPDRRFFHEALARLGGVDPASALVIGDGVPDIAGGRAIGARTVAILAGYGDRAALLAAGPDHAVESTADVGPRMGL